MTSGGLQNQKNRLAKYIVTKLFSFPLLERSNTDSFVPDSIEPQVCSGVSPVYPAALWPSISISIKALSRSLVSKIILIHEWISQLRTIHSFLDHIGPYKREPDGRCYNPSC